MLNNALRSFLETYAFEGPPYPTTLDFVSHLRRVVPPDQVGLIEDLFETITLFDNRVVAGTYVEQDDGTYLVSLETSSLKLRGDGHGAMTEIAMDDWIEFGVFGERQNEGDAEETVLMLEKRRVQSTESVFTAVVDQRPVWAGIDPYNKRIDRNSGDNVRRLTERPHR